MSIEELENHLPGIDLINDLNYRQMSWEELRSLAKWMRKYQLGTVPAYDALAKMKFWELEALRDLIEKYHNGYTHI